MPKSIIEIVGDIIAGQASQRSLTAEEIDKLIKQTYRSLKEIETLETRGGSLEEIDKSFGIQPSTPEVYQLGTEQTANVPKIDPRESIQDNEIICVECGQSFKVISHTHLKTHGLTPEQYKKKWGIREPLTARSVSERRKAQAQERNVGEQLRQARAAKRASSPDETAN